MRPNTPSALALTAALLLACSHDPKPEPDLHDDPPPNEMVDEEAVEPDPEVVQAPDEEPSFELSLSLDKLPLPQGAEQSVTVQVRRLHGFGDAIALSSAGLPAGVTIDTGTIAADQASITLHVRASGGAPHSLPSQVTIRGSAGTRSVDKTLTLTVTGQPGALDTSFGAMGKVVVPVGASEDAARALTVQADGKLVLVGQSSQNLGDVALARLERDGKLDTSFGSGGTVLTSLGSGADAANAVTLDAEGRILVAGSSSVTGSGLDFAVLRYLPDGKLDPSFGRGGIVTSAFSADTDVAYAIAVQPDGKVVVGGEANMGASSTGIDFALARYLSDGSLDPSFGNGGKVTASLASSSGRDTIYALALQTVADEVRIVAAGGEGDFALARFRATGALDTSFGNAGKRVGVLGSSIGAARALTFDAQGNLFVAGHHTNDFALVKLDAQGQTDTRFGNRGLVVTPVSASNWDVAHGVVVQSDQRIVLAGWSYEGQSSSGNFALVRYQADGSIDHSFGAQGVVIAEVAGPGKRDEAHAVALQSDERVPTVRAIAAGFSAGTNQDFAAARFWL